MKAYIGVDARLGIVHSVIATSSNQHNIAQKEHLLHGNESMVFSDVGYQNLAALVKFRKN